MEIKQLISNEVKGGKKWIGKLSIVGGVGIPLGEQVFPGEGAFLKRGGGEGRALQRGQGVEER